MTSSLPQQAVVPRRQSLWGLLASFNRRIRYLETHRPSVPPPFPTCGVAAYSYSWGDSPPAAAATWTPDFDLLGVVSGPGDTIGCEPGSGGLEIPAGWFWWASVSFEIKTSAAPTAGDSLLWQATSRAGYGAIRSDVLIDSSGDTAQSFSAVIGGAAGAAYDVVQLGVVASALGTEFSPQEMSVGAWGLFNFGCGMYIVEDG